MSGLLMSITHPRLWELVYFTHSLKSHCLLDTSDPGGYTLLLGQSTSLQIQG